MPQSSITKICLKITCLKFHSNFPGANELIHSHWAPKHKCSIWMVNPDPVLNYLKKKTRQHTIFMVCHRRYGSSFVSSKCDPCSTLSLVHCITYAFLQWFFFKLFSFNLFFCYNGLHCNGNPGLCIFVISLLIYATVDAWRIRDFPDLHQFSLNLHWQRQICWSDPILAGYWPTTGT